MGKIVSWLVLSILLSPLAHPISGQVLGDHGAISYLPLDTRSVWATTLNGSWRFRLDGPEQTFFQPEFDDSGWSEIVVPGNWELQGFEEPRYARPGDNVGLYRRTFDVPTGWQGRRVYIRFEGVAYGYEFWINGRHAGRFESAYNRSEFDITDLVEHDGPNSIAVRVYRRFKGWEFDINDDWALSGIYRDVVLFSVPEIHFTDVTVITDVHPSRLTAAVHMASKVSPLPESESGTVAVMGRLTDPNGRIIGQLRESVTPDASVRSHIEVRDPLLWNAETPHLYTLVVELWSRGRLLHAVTRYVGIRTVSVDGDVLLINHSPVKIRGVNHHDIHPEVEIGRAHV